MMSIKRPDDQYATDFFSTNRWMLKCAGLWRPNTTRKSFRFLYTVYAILTFVFVNLWFTGTEFASLFYTYKNQYELIKNVNFFLTHFMGDVKVVFWFFYGYLLRDIMKVLENPDLQYDGYMDFNPGRISRFYKKIGRRYSLLFLSLAHATLISSYIPPVLTVFQSLSQSGKGNDTHQIPNTLPYYCWMPFSYDTAYKYLLAVAYQAGPMFSYAYSVVGMDTLFMNIMNCIAGNVTLIQGAAKTLRERCVRRSKTLPKTGYVIHEPTMLMTEMDLEMRKIVKHLQITLRACKQLETVYCFITLSQVTATLFILCTSLYLVSIAPQLSKQFFVEVVYMTAMLFELYLYCWFGNEVTLKLQQLPAYIWENNWLATDDYFKKNMMFTMLRMKKPVYFTAGKFAPLTLPTFMAILKTSYSIFALIKNSSD